MNTITRDEFDRRLEQATEQMRQKRLSLEARTAELAEVISQYAVALERLEAEAERKTSDPSERRDRECCL